MPLCRIELISDEIPEQSTIPTFRQHLEKNGLAGWIVETVQAHLSARGMTVRQGTIVDATMIAAPSCTKTKDGKRDQDMHQAKKGSSGLWGCSRSTARCLVSCGVNKNTDRIDTVVISAANLNGLSRSDQLLHGRKHVGCGDGDYQCFAKNLR